MLNHKPSRINQSSLAIKADEVESISQKGTESDIGFGSAETAQSLNI